MSKLTQDEAAQLARKLGLPADPARDRDVSDWVSGQEAVDAGHTGPGEVAPKPAPTFPVTQELGQSEDMVETSEAPRDGGKK